MVNAIGLKLNLLPGFRRPKRPPVYTRLPLVEDLAHKTLNRVRQPEGNNLSEKTVLALNATDLGASFSRHVLELIPSIGPKHTAVTGLCGLSSSIGLVVGSAVLVGNGIADLNKSQKIGDAEGARRAGAQIASGAILTNGSALSLAHSLSAPALLGLGIAADVFYGLGSILTLGISGWSVYRETLLRSRIKGLMENKNLNEKERVVKTLEFLKEKLTPTAEEKEAIRNDVEKRHPDWDSSRTLAEVDRKIANLAEVKARYFKRRTNQKTTERLLQELDQHLWQLRGPGAKEARPGGDKVGEVRALAAAKTLIGKVQGQSLKNLLIDALIGVASLIALLGVIVGNFLSLGALSFALYGISSAIALALFLYPILLDKFKASRSEAIQNAITVTPITVITSGSV
jgi:hypothetical protein